MNSDSRMIRTTVYLSADLRERLRATAAMRRMSTAALMRLALEAGAIQPRPAPVGGFLREASDGQ